MLTETTMVQLIVSSYPLPFSILHPGGIDHNNCCILDMDSSTPLYSAHYPIPQMKDNVLIVYTNVAWIQRQKSAINGTRLWVQLGKCSVNIDWFRILSEFVRLLKELRIEEEEEICTVLSKFMLHYNCLWTIV